MRGSASALSEPDPGRRARIAPWPVVALALAYFLLHLPYLAPSLEDMPELDNVILESPSRDGPFGAKAIGEMANNAQPPAIVNAIFDAVGVWVTDMPATPERVLAALEAKREARRDGKRVIFDERLSVKTVSSNGGAGFLNVDA